MGLGLNKLEGIELPKPKYIDDNGIEQNISLEVISSSNTLYEFENTTNLIKTYFKKNVCDYSPVRVIVEDKFFEWTPFGVGFFDEYENEDWFGRINSVDAEIINENRVIYKNLINGIDDEFIVNVGELKHNTILNSKPIYKDNLPGKQISLVVDGKVDFSIGIDMWVNDTKQPDEFETSSEIEFKDENKETVFTLPPPIAYEINGIEKINCVYRVSKKGNIITLKIFTPYSWLEASNRIYPVAIDPTLSIVNFQSPPLGISSSTFSATGKYLALSTSSNYKPYVYKIDETANTLVQLPVPQGDYPLRGNYSVCFSPDENYFAYSGNLTGSRFFLYRFNTATKGFTDLIPTPITDGINSMTFSNNGNYFLYSFLGVPGYLVAYNFDRATGAFSNRIAKSLGTSIGGNKIKLTKDDNIAIVLLSNNKLRIIDFSTRNLDKDITIPGFLSNLTISDFDISVDNKFISFSFSGAPYFCVCSLNSKTGEITNPIYPITNIPDENCQKIALSRKMEYVALFQYKDRTSTQTKIIFYKFDHLNGVVGERIEIDPSIPKPKPNNYTAPTALEISPNGKYLFAARNSPSDLSDSMFLYNFFYEPENNIYFKDPISKDYYSDNKGKTLMLIDFGTIVAGQTTSPKRILLENCYDYAVNNIQLSISNPSQEFKVELSESDVPFMPQQTLHFNQTLNTRESIQFYIRVTTTDQSQSGGMFEVLAKCDVV